MSNFDKAIKIIMAEPPEPRYPSYYADLLREADVPDKDVGECSESPNSSETIYRQAAIDALRTCYDTEAVTYTNGNEYISYDQALDLIEALPSAQPETHEKRSETHACDLMPSAEPGRILYANMSDAEFEKWLYEHGICNPNIHESIPCDAVPLLIDSAISEWPSAQLERKKGKWIQNGNGTYSCSVCQSWIPEEQHYYAQYCLYCGADMRGE